VAAARRHDPIPRFARYLRHLGLLDEDRAAQVEQRADEEVRDAVEFAGHAPLPARDRAFADIYEPPASP
jgi:TPP-dependent pyruvate/acetoin dehydrogenase alpha subunit